MATIHIFRHGETEANLAQRVQGQLDSPLTPTGEQQAVEARSKIHQVEFDVAFSSSSGRALATSRLLLNEADVPLTPLDTLREIHLGEWEGRLVEEIKQTELEQLSTFWNQPHLYQPGSGESFAQVRQRGLEAITAIAREHQGKTILLVSHAGFIKTLLTHLSGRPEALIWQEPIANNCAHSIVSYHEHNGFIVEKFCDQVWK